MGHSCRGGHPPRSWGGSPANEVKEQVDIDGLKRVSSVAEVSEADTDV